MSVVDASVLVDALIVDGPVGVAAREVLAAEPVVDAPAIIRAEAISALRRLEATGRLSRSNALAALDELSRLNIRTYLVSPFIDRIWQLRSTLSVYDAWYVSLAEALGTELLTTDARLAGASGPRCSIDIVGP